MTTVGSWRVYKQETGERSEATIKPPVQENVGIGDSIVFSMFVVSDKKLQTRFRDQIDGVTAQWKRTKNPSKYELILVYTYFRDLERTIDKILRVRDEFLERMGILNPPAIKETQSEVVTRFDTVARWLRARR